MNGVANHALLVAAAAILGGCERSDPLSVIPNPSGTALLHDVLVGDDARLICVTRPKESCGRRNSQLYITDVPSLLRVQATWENDATVIVYVTQGKIQGHREQRAVPGISLIVRREPPGN